MFLCKEHFAKVVSYLRENRSADFIVAFMMLLVAAAVALSADLALVAEVLANLAYFSLVIGVGIQLVGFLRQNKKSDESVCGAD